MIDEGMTNQFLELIEENKKLIYKVSHMFSDKSTDRADLFQEILANVWKAFPNFKRNSKASTWIYRISINTAVSWMRDLEKNSKHVEYRNVIPQIQNEPEVDELHERLHGAISQLGSLDKALILLQLDGYSYEEIAEIIGLTKTNVATKLNRIKLKLKNHLSNN